MKHLLMLIEELTGNYVINPELQSGSHMVGRTLGIPVYVNDQMTSGQAVFGDFSRSVVGFHGGGAILEIDPYYDFQKGSVAVRLIEDVSFGILMPMLSAQLSQLN